MNYSEALKNYLEKHNISIQMFACWCGLSPQTVSSILKGKKKLRADTSKKILIGTKGELDFNIPYTSKRLYMKNFWPTRKDESKKVHCKARMGSD